MNLNVFGQVVDAGDFSGATRRVIHVRDVRQQANPRA
jgi:hypothetical protein